MSEEKITFSFEEIEPDTKTFTSRLLHFLEVTDPKYFMASDEEISSGVDTVKKFKKLAKESQDGKI